MSGAALGPALRRSCGIVCTVIAIISTAAAAARADSILVSPSHYAGYRTSPAGLGISPTGYWAEQDVKIAWAITEDAGVFTYNYTLSALDGGKLKGAVSHFILETSSAFTLGDVLPGSNTVIGPQWWTPAMPSNPNMPEPIWGLKFDFGGGIANYTLVTTKAPVWGDFYTKDGAAGHLGFNAAWSAGIGTDPTATTTNFTPWIPTPDTLTVVPPVPLPGAAWMGLALFGTITGAEYIRRRKRFD